jgi:uncharacterized protein
LPQTKEGTALQHEQSNYSIAGHRAMSAQGERTWSALVHLSMLLNLVTGFLGPVAALVVWLVYRDRSPRVAFHALQSMWYQVAWLVILAAGWILTTLLMVVLVGFLLIPVMIVVSALPFLHAGYAAYKVYQGDDYRYPIAGYLLDLGGDTEYGTVLGGTLVLAAHLALVFGLVALWAAQAERSGPLGSLGMVLGVAGTTLVCGVALVEIAGASGAEVEAVLAAGLPAALALLAGLAFLVGLILFGAATMRAGVFPRLAGLLLIGGLGAKSFALYLVDEHLAFHGGIHYGKFVERLSLDGREATGEVRAMAEEAGAECEELIVFGRPDRSIFTAIEELEADPIFFGDEGMSGLEHALMGSVCEEAMRHANTTALVIGGHPDGEGPEEGS